MRARDNTYPEVKWLDVSTAMIISGLGRNTIYDAINSGAIKSVQVVKRGKTKGRRLINTESLNQWIESFADPPRVARWEAFSLEELNELSEDLTRPYHVEAIGESLMDEIQAELERRTK